jgi:hypothetical protein
MPAGEEDTEQLYSELEDAEFALEAFGDVVLGGERTAPGELVVVVKVARTGWRRHGWGRTQARLGVDREDQEPAAPGAALSVLWSCLGVGGLTGRVGNGCQRTGASANEQGAPRRGSWLSSARAGRCCCSTGQRGRSATRSLDQPGAAWTRPALARARTHRLRRKPRSWEGARRSGRARREALLAPPPSMAAGVRSNQVGRPPVKLGRPSL